MLEIKKTGFLKFMSDKGMTITQLMDLKNTATNMVQRIRLPFQKADIYDKSIKPIGWDIIQEVKGFVPTIESLNDVVYLEGKLSAFIEFATKIAEAHDAEKKRIAMTDWSTIVDFTPFIFSQKEKLESLEKEIEEFNKTKPVFVHTTSPVRQDNVVDIIDFLDPNDVFKYLVANQTASALGNLILHDESNSRNPRNFLFKIFEQSYVPFFEGNTLYTPVLTGQQLEEYQNAFFGVQSEHRTFEKARNHFKVQYQTYSDETGKADLAAYTEEYQKYSFDENERNTVFQKDYADWNLKLSKLITEFNELQVLSRQEDNLRTNNLRNQAEQIRKGVESTFFSLRVWLPEEARQVETIIKKQRGE